MAGPLDRQPTKLDYSSPTQFKFGIHQLPKVEYFVTACTLPSVSLGTAIQATPFKDIRVPGEKLTYGSLEVTFLVDEYLENYTSLYNWMTGIGFPVSRSQFSQFRDVTSNSTEQETIGTPLTDVVGTASPDKALYSDGYLMILSNKNNPIVEIDFQDLYPTSLGTLDYNQGATDVEYLTMSATFEYKIFTINPL
jgi:hypothetical protein